MEFQVCPACDAVMLVCTEVGTVFEDPLALLDGDLDVVSDGRAELCPRCDRAGTETFRPATSDEIRALGFKLGEYV